MKQFKFECIKLTVTKMHKYDAPRDWIGSNIKESNQFLYCLDGESILSVDGKNYIITPNTLMLFPEGHIYSTRLTSTRRFSYFQCHFNAELDGVPVFKALELDEGPLAVTVHDPEMMLSLFEGGVHDSSFNDADAIRLNRNACALKIIAEYVRLRRQAMPQKGAEDFKNVIDYMSNNLSKSLSISELAEIMHLEPSYFIRKFSSVLRCAPMQYFDRLRMQKAMQLLESSQLSFEAIAKEIGIENKYYFNRFFMKHAHVSPKEYREVLNDYDF